MLGCADVGCSRSNSAADLPRACAADGSTAGPAYREALRVQLLKRRRNLHRRDLEAGHLRALCTVGHHNHATSKRHEENAFQLGQSLHPLLRLADPAHNYSPPITLAA